MHTLEPMPEALRGHLRGAGEPVSAPRDAATVALLRDGSDGIETYLLRRHRTMAFAAGSYVFPGGRVDERDADVSLAWVGPSPEQWAARFDCEVPLARALVCAAVRETFEESGVLLAGADASCVVADTSGPDWQEARMALERRDLSLAVFLAERALVLRADLIGAWAHWITPEFEPRRFDTRFFVAVLPAGQAVGSMPGEADRAGWISLVDALAGVESETMTMLPPTRITCAELTGLHHAANALEAATHRSIVAVLPELVDVDGDPYLRTEMAT